MPKVNRTEEWNAVSAVTVAESIHRIKEAETEAEEIRRAGEEAAAARISAAKRDAAKRLSDAEEASAKHTAAALADAEKKAEAESAGIAAETERNIAELKQTAAGRMREAVAMITGRVREKWQ